MSYKRIIEKDLVADVPASEAFTSEGQNLYLGEYLSCQVVSAIQDDTPINFTDTDVDVENSTIAATGLEQGALVVLSTDETLPDPLAPATNYYVITKNLTPGLIQLATSAANAEAGIFIELTDAGTEGAANVITPDTFGTLSVSLEKSNDGENWVVIGSATNVAMSGTVFIDLTTPINFKYVRFKKTLAGGGSVAMKAWLLVLGKAT